MKPAAREPTPVDPHQSYERRQIIWLFSSFVLIALLTLTIMLYAAWQSGWNPWRHKRATR